MSPAERPGLLEAVAVRKTYGHLRRQRSGVRRTPPVAGAPAWAVDGVDLAIRPGEIVGLVGQSGSGKSTLANCLAGLAAIDDGEVRYDGRVVARAGELARVPRVRGVQVVYQDPHSSLNPRRTVGSVLHEILRVHRLVPRPAAQDRCVDLLDRVGLPARVLDQRPRALSGGMCQRVAIARALAFSPRVLIADEVVSALDASVQAQVLNLLADLREAEGIAILFVTHDLSVVNQLCDSVVVLHRGRAVEVGPTAQVLHAPRHAYTQQLLAAVPRLSAAAAT